MVNPKYFKKLTIKENNWPDYGLQNLLGEENTESELIGGILGIRASMIMGQVATEYGRRTLWKHGVIRMSQEQGVTKLFVIVSDCMQILMKLMMATSDVLPKGEVLRILDRCP